MVKALADRLAEAFAEFLHERARARLGLRRDEKLSNDDLIDEELSRHPAGLRLPGVSGPHREADALRAARAPATGITLTETFAMLPAASVSGLYFAHPEARYFAVDRIGRDQVEDYAGRKRGPLEEVERWLVSDLAYSPEPQPVAV